MIELISSIANLISSVLALITSIIAYKLASKKITDWELRLPFQKYYNSICNNMQVLSLIISIVALCISIAAFVTILKKRK